MKVSIYPIKRLYYLLKEGNAEDCAAVISSSAEVDAERLTGVSYVFRQYEDIDTEIPGRSFSEEDAKCVLSFLQMLDQRIGTVYCCCDAGRSRSPAVAAAICRYYGLEDLHIWQNPQYHPNMLVFDTLTRVFGIPVSDVEKDRLLYANHQAFRNAIRQKRTIDKER